MRSKFIFMKPAAGILSGLLLTMALYSIPAISYASDSALRESIGLKDLGSAEQAVQEVPQPASESDDAGQQENVITLEFWTPEDIDTADRQYGAMFEGGDIKLRTTGYSDFYIPFLQKYNFNSLDLEMIDERPDLFYEGLDGISVYLSDVKGLTTLRVPDLERLQFMDAGIFNDLKELVLTETDHSLNALGRVDSHILPSLETLTLYYEDEEVLKDQLWRTQGLIFPETLKNLNIYINGKLENPVHDGFSIEIVRENLAGALTFSCPDVIVNNVALNDIKAAFDQLYWNDIDMGFGQALAYRIYSDAVHGFVPLEQGTPPFGGKIVYAEIEKDEMTYCSAFNSFVPSVFLKEYMPDSIQDADLAVIIFTETGNDTSVLISDFKAGTTYMPFTPETEFEKFYPGDTLEELFVNYDPSYRSAGTYEYIPFKDAYRDLLTQIIAGDALKALDNEVYTQTLEALKNGEIVYSGSYSTTAAGLQQTLVDMGCSITVDGSAGPATFNALNNVLSAFEMGSTDTVDAELYAKLLPLLLISRDGEMARESIGKYYFAGESSDELSYLRGCALCVKERYYDAMLAFGLSNYGDYEQRMQQCVRTWPANGEVWHNSSYYSQNMSLTFVLNNIDASKGTYFEIYTREGTLVATLFIHGSSSATTWIPGGVYRIRYASGSDWYGYKNIFGSGSSWTYMTFYEYEDDDYSTYLESGYEWVITMNAAEASGSSVGSTWIPWDNAWGLE